MQGNEPDVRIAEHYGSAGNISRQKHKQCSGCKVFNLLENSLEPAMADDKSKRGPRDASRINMHEDYEVRYWSEKFGVSKEELAEAVRRAGSMAKDVETDLQNKKRKWG
jgi:hypothetical protein